MQFTWALTTVAALATAVPALAQQPQTRADEIELARREKGATLWPERESPMVARANAECGQEPDDA
jgi:hypothetical protein